MKKYLLLSLFFAFLFLSCSKSKNEIKIGVTAPLTGDVASYGERVKNAVNLAVEEINTAGGISGAKLNLILEDDKCQPQNGVSAINKLISVDKVPIVLGAVCSSVTLAMAPVAEKSKVVLFTPISSNYEISEAGDYIFRLAPSDALQGKIIAQWAKELGYKTAGIIYINNDYGKGLENGFKKDFEALGGKVLVSESFQQGNKDYRAQLSKLKSANPDFIFAPAYPAEAGPLLKQRKELGVNIQIIGTDPYHDPKIFEAAGTAADGVIFTDVAGGSGKEWDVFVKNYKSKYGIEPDIVAAEAYDALKITAHIMGNSGTSSDAIKNGLYGIKDYRGATGKIEFDKNGDCYTKSFQKFKIQDGKYQQF